MYHLCYSCRDGTFDCRDASSCATQSNPRCRTGSDTSLERPNGCMSVEPAERTRPPGLLRREETRLLRAADDTITMTE
ncbi:hypothetical protein V8C44DRAFT_315534 [Trichoderma aethiopicum]